MNPAAGSRVYIFPPRVLKADVKGELKLTVYRAYKDKARRKCDQA